MEVGVSSSPVHRCFDVSLAPFVVSKEIVGSCQAVVKLCLCSAARYGFRVVRIEWICRVCQRVCILLRAGQRTCVSSVVVDNKVWSL